MTRDLSYGKLPHDQKVLVVGVVSGNLGDYLESHPRVIWWHRDQLHRHTSGYPAGVGRVFVTKFIPHSFHGRLRQWNDALDHRARTGEWVPHVVSGFGSTGELKRLIYQSLGEHHPKHNPTEEQQARVAAVGNRGLTAMGDALVKAAVQVQEMAVWACSKCGSLGSGDECWRCRGSMKQTAESAARKLYMEKYEPASGWKDDATFTAEWRASGAPPPAPPYGSLSEWLEQFWPWDDAGPDTEKARWLYQTACEAGVTRATKDSFVTIATKWARENRARHVATVAERDVAVETVLGKDRAHDSRVEVRESRPFTPAPNPDIVAPVAADDRRQKERPADTTAGDAKALLSLVAEAKRKALEVVSTLEIVESTLPGLVEGLEKKEQRIEAAIAALRNL